MESGAKPWDEEETLSELDQAFETLMLGLRMTEGVSRVAFKENFGYDFGVRFQPMLQRWIEADLARMPEDRLMLTAAGMDVQNALLVELMERMGL